MSTKEMTRPASSAATPAKALAPKSTPHALNPFEVLQKEIDRVFETFTNWPAAFPQRVFSPSMEVTETDTTMTVSTELPGMTDKDVNISVADGVLTISGEKKVEKDEKKKSYRVVECSYGSFERSVALPPGADASRIKAKMANGVLKVEVPKPPAAKAQPVKITAG